MPNTSYDYYVQADCGGTGTSTWSGPFTFVTDVLGTADNAIDGFTFYSNPMNEVLHLRANSTIESVVIYNILGQKVIDQNIGSITTQLNVSNLSTGDYLMKVVSAGQTGIYRLIKK
ncbi:T9SS type A sorting domain-containing protein [Aequorivita lipolytica]|uniref:T9SS type A sorting domain-containing protein n=2 Tax=Aequorivita lipolytica TaxID=153267 RepID=A0A5C6YQ24_9FLAO|nr:T9SS type A sorting domain-containing protein [Aequorivita lipolytica]